MYKHILIATDGSHLAQRGVDHGLALASRLKASASIVVVSELVTGALLAGEADAGIFSATEELRRASRAAAERILQSAGAQAKRLNVDHDLVLVADTLPADGILDTATNRKCDLIVLASHGARGIERLLLGSQAIDVVTRSRIPVLIVR